MAYHTGETAVHVTPVQHFQPRNGYPQASMQRRAWPPPYFQAHSYQEPAFATMKQSHPASSQRPDTQTPPQDRIQPDPLPPHSKPQDLSPTQSRAFAGPMPCKPVRLGKEDVFYRDSCVPLLAISKEAVHMPSFLSSKPLLTITRCNTNARLGTIRFHTMTTSDIELNVNGRDLVLSSSRLHNRWTFQPTSIEKAQPWYWKKDKLLSRCVILVDAKKRGHTLARIDGNILSFEQINLSNETLDEIIMTAVALAEHARRHTKNAEVVDLSSSIADLVGGHGTSHSGTSHHHGHSSGGGGLFFGGNMGGDGGGGGSSGCGDGGGGGGGGGGGDGGGGGGGC